MQWQQQKYMESCKKVRIMLWSMQLMRLKLKILSFRVEKGNYLVLVNDLKKMF